MLTIQLTSTEDGMKQLANDEYGHHIARQVSLFLPQIPRLLSNSPPHTTSIEMDQRYLIENWRGLEFSELDTSAKLTTTNQFDCAVHELDLVCSSRRP